MSIRSRSGARWLTKSRSAKIAVGTAITRFTYRHQRHESTCVRTPPSSRPSDAPPPAIAPKIPNALARSGLPSKVTVNSPSADGASSAPNAPCSARAPTSVPNEVCASPPIAETIANPTSPDDERPLAPEQIAELAPQQQQAAERQRICGDDPLAVARREVERLLRRGQRDVHDRGIEHHHQLRDAKQRQRRPAVRLCAAWMIGCHLMPA